VRSGVVALLQESPTAIVTRTLEPFTDLRDIFFPLVLKIMLPVFLLSLKEPLRSPPADRPFRSRNL
jgi:hypothetical protein